MEKTDIAVIPANFEDLSEKTGIPVFHFDNLYKYDQELGFLTYYNFSGFGQSKFQTTHWSPNDEPRSV